MGESLKEQVREWFAGAARAIRDAVSGKASCCELSCCGSDVADVGALEADVSGGSHSEAKRSERYHGWLLVPFPMRHNPAALAALLPGRMYWIS